MPFHRTLILCFGLAAAGFSMASPASAQALKGFQLGDPDTAAVDAMKACIDGNEGCRSGGLRLTCGELKARGLAKRCTEAAPTRGLSRGIGTARSRGIVANPAAPEPAVQPERVETAAAAARPLPSLDVEINYAFDSDRPLPRSLPTIRRLASAITDERFADATFVLIGHTDAKGSEDYNHALSRRRALSLRDDLVLAAGLSPARFRVDGWGEEQLKDRADPEGAINRRVQVVLIRE